MAFGRDQDGTGPVPDTGAAIDLGTGRLYPVVAAAEQVLAFRPSPASLWRQATKGVVVARRLSDGSVEERRVTLPTVKVAGRRCTTVEAYRAFVTATNPGVVQRLAPGRDRQDDGDTDSALRAAGVLGVTRARSAHGPSRC